MNFTDQLAKYIQENELDLKHLTIILPSERAKKYIAASLFKQFGKPILAPEMITIDRWVKDLSQKTVIDKTRILVKLFQVQLENIGNEKDRSFDEFLSWGNILLSDYDEIDRYMLSSEQVFKNLADIKEIENWSFTREELTEGQKRFMEFWDRLPDYYRRLNKLLDEEGICYMGKAYRFVAENIQSVFEKDKKRHFLFAGFNALSEAEMKIMKQLHVMGRGHVLINADNFYFNNPSHEAGRFLRKLKSELEVKELPYVEDILSHDEKVIEIIECPQTTGQVKVAASLLNNMTKEEIDQTLVLLADESLIAPLLKNLPRQIGKANITLGLPLRNSAVRTWVDLIFAIQENKTRFKSDAVYIQDLQKFWNHPFTVAVLSKEEKERIIQLELELVQRNAIFLSPEKLQIGPTADRLIQWITTNWKEDWRVAIHVVRQMNAMLFSGFGQQDAFEKAIVESFDSALQEFENIIVEGIPTMSLKSFKHLFQQHWNTKSIAYHGNPTQGLQIMGLLETRLLDFEKVIVLGMNEGKMPPTNPIQTMIPMDLRAYFNLPTPRDKQGLFAHHFYRLLHACKKMWITYTSASESIGSNEASRYLMQLELELSRLNPKIRINKQFYSIPNLTSETQANHSIEKTSEIIQRMDELFARSISASAINKYIACPLDFYYRHVLEFGEETGIEEEVENNTFGTFIHNVLEELYEPYARHDRSGNRKEPQPPNITSFDVEKMLKFYEGLITKQFLNHFNGDKSAFETGKNLLSYKMALELTGRILKNEIEFLKQQTEPVFIEYLEARLEADMQVDIEGSTKQVRFKGFIDRIDSIGGKMRIIDYKSGKVKKEDVTVKEIAEDGSNLIKNLSAGKYNLQLIMYSYLYKENFKKIPDEVSIYSLVNLNDGTFPLQGEYTVEKLVELFPDLIKALLTEIYDPAIPFEHKAAAYKSYCQYCE